MALKGLDIFKLSPKTNCKDCGCPTCMAFSMKVAQGALQIEQCPHMSAAALDSLSEATAPPMKTIKAGTGEKELVLGGETVLYRHEKTFVSKSRYAVTLCNDLEDSVNAETIESTKKIDYERISEKMQVELIYVNYTEGKSKEKYLELVKAALELERVIILGCDNVEVAKEALELCKGGNPILNGANASNYEAMNTLAAEYKVVLGVTGTDINELYETVGKLEAAGNKNLILDVGVKSIKDAFATAVKIRRAALKDSDRTFGYPTLVNIAALAWGNHAMQTALASLFTMKYGSIIVMETMSYAQALPLYGLRQNIYTDPQKPMKVEPGIYTLNGGDEKSVCLTTVDFALTYFVVSGELERSGVPCNLLISDAGGYSVLTAWAAGKLSASSIAKFIAEQAIEEKISSRTLILPGKVAVLKGELEAKLPDWDIVVGTNEAVQLVKFLKDYK